MLRKDVEAKNIAVRAFNLGGQNPGFYLTHENGEGFKEDGGLFGLVKWL